MVPVLVSAALAQTSDIPSPPLSGATPFGRDLGQPPAVSLTPGGGSGGLLNSLGNAGDQTSTGRTGPGATGPGAGPEPDLSITPRIDISEAYETNPDGGGFNSGANRGDDFITTITPSVAVSVNRPNLNVQGVYAPRVSLYARDSGRGGIGQNLNASAQAVLVADTLFLQASGYAAYQPALGGSRGGFNGVGGFNGTGGLGSQGIGGLGPNGANSAGLSRQGATQVTNFNIGPYLVHRFGDAGVGKLGVSYGYSTNTQSTGNPTVLSANPVLAQLQQANGNSYENTLHEVAQFTTGEILGRVRGTTLLSLTEYDGSGVSRGAYEDFFTQQVGYAIDRQFTIFGEAGYETIRYKTVPVTRIEDLIWSAGVQWTPDPDSLLSIGYGHKFGYNSVFGNGRYAITARTTLSGSYSVGLGTALQAVQDLVGSTTLDPSGNTLDGFTNAPTPLTSGIIGIAGNNTLYRISRLAVSLTTTLDRDTYQASLVDQQENLVGTSVVGVGTSNRGLTGILTWTHALSPLLSSSLSLNGGTTTQGGQAGTDTLYGVDATLSYVINDTTTTYARYTYFKRDSSVQGNAYDDNTVLIGISKSF